MGKGARYDRLGFCIQFFGVVHMNDLAWLCMNHISIKKYHSRCPDFSIEPVTEIKICQGGKYPHCNFVMLI